MALQRIIWTALPHGVEGNDLKISVFVSPRLAPPSVSTLNQFHDFWNPAQGHWPGKVAGLSISVEFDTNPTPVPAKGVKQGPDGAKYADPEIWSGLFKASTRVGPFQFSDFKNRAIRSYPVRGVLGYLKGLYQKIGSSSPSDHPSFRDDRDLAELRNGLGFINLGRGEQIGGARLMVPNLPDLDSLLKQQKVLDASKYGSYGFPSLELFSFVQANRFFDRPEWKETYLEKPDLTKVPKRLAMPNIEFHQIVAAVSDYPELMRRLGLVIELRVPKPAFAFNKIRVAIKPSGIGFDDSNAVRPWTWCTKDGSFRPLPRPSGSDIANGMLKLAGVNDQYQQQKDPKYDLVQIDPDGGSIKLIDFAANLYRMLNPRTANYMQPEGAALPSLRSGGIGLLKFNRAFHLANLIKDASTRNAAATAAVPTPIDLYAEDILRGYRVDVHDEKGWRSLCRRDGLYTLTASGEKKLTIDDEEGYVKGASTASKDGNASDLYFHEMMFRWNGWSIVAKRPGKTIAPETYNDDRTPKAVQGEVVTADPSEGALPPGVNLDTRFKATPKSLPRLRFGREYRLRARIVDLAGNSEPHTSPDDSQATEKIRYTRFEPINPPALVHRAPIALGESIEHMVIRSNYNVATKPYNDDLNTKYNGGFPDVNERHVVPPKTSQLMAEAHGMFDDRIDSGPAGVAEAYNIAKREVGTFFDRAIVSIGDGAEKPLPDPMSVKLVSPPKVKAQPKYPILKGDPEGFGPAWELNPIDPTAASPAAGQYVIHAEERMLVPYLPDPIARGASLRGFPKSDSTELEKVVKIPFTGKWPEIDTFMLRVLEDPDVDDYCDGKKHDGLAKWDDEKRVLSVYLAKGQIVRLRYGCYLNMSDVKQMGILRWLEGSGGYDNAVKHALAGLHWMVTPWRDLMLVHAVQQPLCEPKITKLQGVKKDVGATLAYLQGNFNINVRSTGKIELLAEWDEPVDHTTEPVPRDNPSNADYLPVHGRAHVFESKIEEFYPDNLPVPIVVSDPSAPDATITVDPEIFRHEFGDTKHRMVDYHLLGATRFREYFPQEITSDPKNISREGPVYQVNIPSSARPDAPKILYVIPTFGWEPPQQVGSDIVSRRCGGGLRVYMDRPWYSSGESEMLGVVLTNSGGGGGSSSGSGTSGGGTGGAGSKFDVAKEAVKEKVATMFGGVFVEPGDMLKPYVTQWGMDPIWGSDPVKAGPTRGDFTIAVDTDGQVAGLSLDELRDGEGNPYPVVSVAPHQVEYDPERKLWFSDIVVDSGDSYYPFIRLALARYQPYSIADCHLSRVVLTDFAQLAPDRVAGVTFDTDRKIRVMVSGVYGINTFTKGEGFNPLDKKTFKNLGYSRRMTVTVETPLVSGTDGDIVGDIGWVPVSEELTEVELIPWQQYESRMVWLIELELPDKPKRLGGKPFRIVVKEYERLESDQEVGNVSLKNEREGKMLEEGKTDTDGMAVFLNDAIARIVYADTIEL